MRDCPSFHFLSRAAVKKSGDALITSSGIEKVWVGPCPTLTVTVGEKRLSKVSRHLGSRVREQCTAVASLDVSSVVLRRFPCPRTSQDQPWHCRGMGGSDDGDVVVVSNVVGLVEEE